jgi:hypothetical protein
MLKIVVQRCALGVAAIGCGCGSAAAVQNAAAEERHEPLPMLANQAKLPRQPLPSLEDSLARYLRAVEPLVPPAALEATRAFVAEQLAPGSLLRKLQSQLETEESTAAPGSVSYVSGPWDDMYLTGRWPLAINSNPGAVSRSKAFGPDATTQIARAARMVAATVAVAQDVESGQLQPDVMKGVPLDMRQYPKMFSATRIPRKGRDELVKATASRSRHIVVLRGNTFWEVPVVDAGTGAPLSVECIEKALQQVCDASPEDSSAEGAAPSVAVLTTADRDKWAAWRAEIVAHSSSNTASLASIDEALFHVCLDQVDLGTKGGAEPARGEPLAAAVRLALCGDARKAPRWFDKSMMLMVSADGVPMFNFEHSWGDGIAVVRCGAETWGRIAKGKYGKPAPPDVPVAAPKRLEIELPASCAKAVEACAGDYSKVCSSLEITSLHFAKWGAAALKKWGVSPDGAAQAALALAFHRTSGRMGATYESCSTAHYCGGRTETIRPASSDMAAWVRCVVEGGAQEEQAALLRAATKRHSAICREAAEGKGFDRHMFVLKQRAEAAAKSSWLRRGSGTPPIFEDPTYKHLAGNELSTSNPPPLPHSSQAGFGPVHPEGYGVCYTTSADGLRFCTTTYQPRSAAEFSAQIESALLHIEKLLESSVPAAK